MALSNWLRQLKKTFSGVRSPARSGRRNRLRIPSVAQLEILEDRTLLATVMWDGGGDGTSWQDELNWQQNNLPAAGDDVIISTNGLVTYEGSDLSIASLDTKSGLLVSDGTLEVTISLNVNGNSIDIQGGTASFLASGICGFRW